MVTKINQEPKNSLAFLIRTSFNMLLTKYLRQNNEEETTNEPQGARGARRKCFELIIKKKTYAFQFGGYL